MTIQGRPKIVVLGMMGRMRVGGGVWQTLHYLVGLRRMGYEPYYIEAHGILPWAFQDREDEIAAFIGSTLRRFDLGDRWAFHARNGSENYYGMAKSQVLRLYDSAAAILNLHGGTVPTPEQSATGRLVYIDTDPVTVQMDVHRGAGLALNVLGQHCALFTFGENYGKSDCGLPVSETFNFKPTRQPVVLDFWNATDVPTGDAFTTIGNWKQLRRVIELNGEEYFWSKHFEFLKFLDLPRRTTQPMELALSGCDEESRALLAGHGWNVRDAFGFSQDLDEYRSYIAQSRAEFTVAKDQNIRLRTGWFSDRSATYLAAGRPVVTQETGFTSVLPSGEGLFGFSNLDEALGAIEAINADYERHRRAAKEIARECFSHDVVLGRLLAEVGVSAGRAHGSRKEQTALTVNIVGDFGSYTGMGATAEAYARAFRAIGADVREIRGDETSGLPAPTASGRRRDEVNVICCDVASHFYVRSRLGDDFFRDRYNIGVWLWECPEFPKKWYDRFAYYDEIWAPTSFVAAALSPVSPVPVIRMPFVIEPRVIGSRSKGRQRLNIHNDEFVYLFVFNFYSRYQRKNPMAVVEAFKRAFRPDEPARLVIKCANAAFSAEHFETLNRQAQGYPIAIHDGAWSEQEMADLMAACDCYVSLHRSEGVGLTIGEAMTAGKPVVATAWSGNMDLMNASNSFPVRYTLVELEENVAHYQAGDVWAEPSVEHASELLRGVYERRAEASMRAEAAQSDIHATYSTEAIAAQISARLEVIVNRKRFQSLKQSLDDASGSDQLHEAFSDLGAYASQEQSRYEQLKKDLREIVRARAPGGATVLVVSRGDDELLNVGPCRGRHFPAGTGDRYAGYHPKDSAEAIERLEAVRAEGGDFLVFPNTAFWWLDHYGDFREHLLARYRMAHRDEQCVMFELR